MARVTPRRRAQAAGPGWGHVLADTLVLVVLAGIGLWVAEAMDWQGSRTFRVTFFAVILLGLLAGYAATTAWNAAHAGPQQPATPRHARHAHRGRRRSR